MDTLKSSAKEIVERYYDYAIDLLKSHNLDVDEYHGVICITLCKIAEKHGYVSNMNSFYHQRLHVYVHSLIQDNNKTDIHSIPIDNCNLGAYCMDWDMLDLHKKLHESINKLDARRKEYIYNKFIVGMTYSEMALLYNLSEETIRTHVQKGLSKLRSIMWLYKRYYK